jgi:hypothetical protein
MGHDTLGQGGTRQQHQGKQKRGKMAAHGNLRMRRSISGKNSRS